MFFAFLVLGSLLTSGLFAAPPDLNFEAETAVEAKNPVAFETKKVPAKGPLELPVGVPGAAAKDPLPVDITVDIVEDKDGGKVKYDMQSSQSGSMALPWESSSKSDGKLVWAVNDTAGRRRVRVEVKNLDMDRLESFIHRTMPEIRRTLTVVAAILALVVLLVVVLTSCACILCCCCCRRAAFAYQMNRLRVGGNVPYSVMVETAPSDRAPIISPEVEFGGPTKYNN